MFGHNNSVYFIIIPLFSAFFKYLPRKKLLFRAVFSLNSLPAQKCLDRLPTLGETQYAAYLRKAYPPHAQKRCSEPLAHFARRPLAALGADVRNAPGGRRQIAAFGGNFGGVRRHAACGGGLRPPGAPQERSSVPKRSTRPPYPFSRGGSSV